MPQAKELAQVAGMSPSELNDLFKRLLGVTPASYLKAAQIECMKRLLIESDIPTDKVGYHCGYTKRTSYYRAFKREVGMTPQEYRNMMRPR